MTRYHLIDAMRGASAVSMVLFHFLYDINMVYGHNPQWYSAPGVELWQQSICVPFILLSGFVWKWGRAGNAARALRFMLCGAGITLVTALTVPEQTVHYGIMSFFGCAVLLMIPVERLTAGVRPSVGVLISALLFVLTREAADGFVGLGEWLRVRLPAFLYRSELLTPLGFPHEGFYSSDYFPLIPWFFLFLCGYFAGELFEKRECLHAAARIKIPVLSGLGRKSVWIYLLHQPLNMLILESLLWSRQ